MGHKTKSQKLFEEADVLVKKIVQKAVEIERGRKRGKNIPKDELVKFIKEITP